MHRPRPSFALTLAATLVTAASAGDGCSNPHIHQPLLNLLPDGAADVVAVQSGKWSDPATWGGTLPGPGDDVQISIDLTVIYDIDDDGDEIGPDTTRFHFVRVDGVLAWDTDIDTTMYVDTLFSPPWGEVIIGDDADPIPADRTARIVIIADDPMTDFPQLSRGFIPHGMNRIVGAPKTPFARLAADATAGASTIALAAAPVGWNIGDTLVLGGSFFDPEGSNDDNSRFHDEVLVVTAINGARVDFVNAAPGVEGLQWDHVRPEGTFFDADDVHLYVANLTRNVTFESELAPTSPDVPTGGDLQDRRRGHVMVMHTNDSIIRNAAFVGFGRLNKDEFIDDPGLNVDGTDGNGANVRGRYGVHHHRNLPNNNQPIDIIDCPPAEITGSVVWGSPGWGFVHHDSHSVLEDNVAFDVLGSAFVQEAGNEIGRWSNNLAIKTTGDDDPEMTVEPFGDGYKRVANFDFGFNGEAFWIQGASQVEFIDNIAISAAGGGASLFSDVDGNSNRDRGVVPVEHLRPEIQHIVTNDAQTIAVNRVPANTFTGFEVSNSDFGLITWNHMRNQGSWIGFTCPCDGNFHREYALVDNFRFWNIYGQGVHLQYSSQIEFRGGIIASSDLATPGVDDKPAINLAINGDGRGFGFGMNGPAKRLIVDDVTIEGWEFGARTPLEGQINALDDGDGTGSEGAMGLPARRSVYRNLKFADNNDNLYRRQNGFSDPASFSNFLVLENLEIVSVIPNEPPVANFTFDSFGPSGVVQLSGLAAFDPDTPNPPGPSNHAVVVNDANDIVAYGWDLDGDGAIDEFGERITTSLPPDQSTPVTLTVWDHQGATDTITLDVTPTPAAYEEMIINGGFEGAEFNDGSIHSGSTDLGWFGTWGEFVDGGVRLAGQFDFGWTGQAVYDNRVRRGDFELAFDYILSEGHDDPNDGQISRLHVRLWGINGEFHAYYLAFPAPAGAIPYAADLLYEEWFETPVDLTSIARLVDVGTDGYTYFMISARATGVDHDLPDDFAWIDNIAFVGAGTPPCPADLTDDATVGAADLGTLLSAWGPTGGPADLDGDGTVGPADLATLLTQWGLCPEVVP